MIKETVQAVGVTHIVTESGSKTLLGNRQFEIGDSVWTHGNFAFGTEQNSGIMILPTRLPAEGGRFIVEFHEGDFLFKIRDVVTMQVIAEITTPFSDNETPSPKFCYDADTLTFYAVSGGANYGEGVTIHTVAHGVYTTELVDLPSGGYCSDVTCRVVNHQLTWIAFVNDIIYQKWTTFKGEPYKNVGGTVALYEYIGNELQNTYDYTSRVNAIYDEAWATLNAHYNNDGILTWVKANELSQDVGNGASPLPYTTTEYEVTILRRPATADGSYYAPLGTYNSTGDKFYSITNYGSQYPRIYSSAPNLISFEEKLIAVAATATSYLYLGVNKLDGTADIYPYQYILNSPYGQLQSKRYVLLDVSNNYTTYTIDKFIKETWNIYDSSTAKILLKLINLGNGYGSNESYNLVITYNGPNAPTTNTYNGEWQQLLDYGCFVDVVAVTSAWNGSKTPFSYTAVIDDGKGWTHDITNDFGYNPRYPDFLSLDVSGNIIYYSGWQDVLYLIDKATHAVTTIHSDPLYNQMQMPFIEGFKDAIIASLTV